MEKLLKTINPYGLLALSTILCGTGYMVMAVASHMPGHHLYLFLGLSFICAMAGAITVLRFQQAEVQIPFAWIILSALLFRIVGVFGQPLLEDDFYRYLWDGYLMATTGDSYSIPPSHYFGSEQVPQGMEFILSNINYPDVTTVYGPVLQWIFALGYLIDPGAVWPLQCFSAAADLGILLLLRNMRLNNFLLLYAWSPLLIKEFAFTAHPDSIAVFLLLAGWQLIRNGKFLWAGALLGFAVGSKIFALILLPFLLFQTNSVRNILMACTAILGTIGLITLSFGTPLIWAPGGLQTMATNWLFNAPFHLMLGQLLDLQWIKLALMTVFALFMLWQLYTFANRSPNNTAYPGFRGDWIYGVFLLCIPVVNPWYLIWILPFAVLMPSKWAWVASGAVLLSYISGANLPDSNYALHQIPLWVLTIEFGAIAAAFWFDRRRPLCQLSAY